jgi:hypothetical protein
MIAITAITVATIAGAMACVVAVVRASIAREESGNSLRGEPPTLAAALTRHIVGLYVRLPERGGHGEHEADRPDAGQGQCPPAIGSGR